MADRRRVRKRKRSGSGRVTFAERARSERTRVQAETKAKVEADRRRERDETRGMRFGSGLIVPQARFTSADASVLFPAHFSSATPHDGVFIGVDVLSGQAPFFADEWRSYARAGDKLNDTNGIICGAIGGGKTATAIARIWREAAIYGPKRRFVMIVSPKAEDYDDLAEALGYDVVRLRPGGDQRINPLDIAGSGPEQVLVRQQLCRELIESVNGTVLGPLEAAVVDSAVTKLSVEGGEITLGDVHKGLRCPSQTFLDAMKLTEPEMLALTVNARAGLERLVNGSMGGLFNGDSSVRIDWDNSNGILIDLSALRDTDAFAPMLLVTAVWLREAWKARRKAVPGSVALQLLDEAWALICSSAASIRADLKESRAIGLSTWFIVHRTEDMAAAADDGSAASKLAKELLNDVSTRLLFRDSADVAASYESLFGMSPTIRAHVPKLVKGRCVWMTPGESRVIQVMLSDRELVLCDSDAAMRAA